MGKTKKDQTSDNRNNSRSDRREIPNKMKEKYIDYFVPEEENKRTGKDRRDKDNYN